MRTAEGTRHIAKTKTTIQDHYDFGMRALKSVLLMAGGAKRGAEAGADEDGVLISAIRNANLPKLTSEVGFLAISDNHNFDRCLSGALRACQAA